MISGVTQRNTVREKLNMSYISDNWIIHSLDGFVIIRKSAISKV